MASSRRTYDTDVITLRTVFAKNVVNSNIPALRTLTADGAGGTYWAIPSSLGQNPSFNEIITSAATYTADLSYNRFRLLAGEGVGMVNGPAGSNQTTLFGKGFLEVDVSGGNAFYSFSNNTLTPNIRIATTGAIQARADPATNTLFIDGPVSNPYIVSTGQYGFYQVKVTPQASTITSSIQEWGGDFITASSPSTLLRFVGYNDIKLSTNVTTNAIFFTISTFTSKGYLDISAAAFSAYPSSLSTISSLYVQSAAFYSTIYSMSTLGVQWSSVQSSINALAFSTGEQFYTLTGLINARATIIQLNSEIASVNRNIRSTVQGLGSVGYISSPSFVSTLQTPFGTNTFELNCDFNNVGRIFYSSFTFNLSSFSSFISEKTRILIQENPNFIFSGISSQNATYGDQYKGQITQIGLLDNPATVFSESQTSNFIPFSINESQSNFFTTSLLMPLAATSVLTNIQSNFATYHDIPQGFFFSTPTQSNSLGFRDSTIKIGFYGNSLFLHLYNS